MNGGQQHSEKSPQIVIISPEENNQDNHEDVDNMHFVKSDPEVSGRLSVLSGESAGSRSLMSRLSGHSVIYQRMYKYENMFLVLVFVIIALAFLLVGICIGTVFLCQVCHQKEEALENITTVEDFHQHVYSSN